MGPWVCPFYGQLTQEEFELLQVPHGTPVGEVKKVRRVRRIVRRILRTVVAIAFIVAFTTLCLI
jgi:hypothetical protein